MEYKKWLKTQTAKAFMEEIKNCSEDIYYMKLYEKYAKIRDKTQVLATDFQIENYKRNEMIWLDNINGKSMKYVQGYKIDNGNGYYLLTDDIYSWGSWFNETRINWINTNDR